MQFAPGLDLDTAQYPGLVTVKGQSPRLDYAFNLIQIYPQIPSVDPQTAYKRIRQAVERVDRVLFRDLKLPPHMTLPTATDEVEALTTLRAVFDPHKESLGHFTGDLTGMLQGQELFRLGTPRPFALKQGTPAKLLHTLAWIDTNIKVQVERVGMVHRISDSTVREIVENALLTYSILIKMQDYRLALRMNFNHSMFLQDRILNLLLGDELFFGSAHSAKNEILMQGALSNRMALQLLRGLGSLSPRSLCAASLFMGTVWTGEKDTQRDFEKSPERVLAMLEGSLNDAMQQVYIDDIDDFLSYAGTDPCERLLVILDDNGESVFDLTLCQELLRHTGHLAIDLVVNRYPVSNNIALETLEELLRDEYFRDLSRHLSEGRLAIVIEEQVFRSFEYDYLKPTTRESVKRAGRAYIKGANFFETFQPAGIIRYYCFTVHGFTSQLLTGCPQGAGIFARVSSDQVGYVYDGPGHIVTLRESNDRSQ